MERKLRAGRYFGSISKSVDVNGLILTEGVYPPDLRIPRHSHENPYFFITLQGSASEVYGTRSKTRTYTPFTVAFCPAGEMHTEQIANTGMRCLRVEIMPNWLKSCYQGSGALEHSVSCEGSSLHWLGFRLYDEFRDMDDVSPMVMEGLTLEILAGLKRRCVHASERKAPRWLEQARALLHARFSERISLAEIAQSVQVHQVHLAREFRRRFHCTVGEYLRQIRIEFACRELYASDTPLSDLALQAGFSHQSHFTSAFRRLTGTTPARFRLKERGKR